MKITLKNKLFLFLAALLFLSGCSGTSGGSASSGSASAYYNESVEGDNIITRSYSVDNLTENDNAVLVVSCPQDNVTFDYSVTNSKLAEIENFSIKDVLSLDYEANITSNNKKDLDADLIKYAEFINKTVGVNKKDIKAFKAYNEGDEEDFHILLNGSTFSACRAKCYKAGLHCYVFIDTSSENILDKASIAEKIAKAFDTDNSPFSPGSGIYDKTKSYYGSEWSPGIDNDSKIFILISPKLGDSLYGYFFSYDETTSGSSNQKEIIYANDDIFAGNMYNGLATIAHEFSHLINYNMKYKLGGSFEETTISEGSAVLCEHLNGFTVNKGENYAGNGYIIRSIKTFLSSPQLFYFPYWLKNNYGAAFLFMLYVMEKYGADVFKNIQQSPKTGTANIETYTKVLFSDLFQEWMLVNYYSGLNGTPVLPSGSSYVKYKDFNPKGGYEGYSTRDNLSVYVYLLDGVSFRSSILLSSGSGNANVGKYNCNYYKIVPNQTSENLKFIYSSKSENSTKSYFIIEKPAGTFYSIQ